MLLADVEKKLLTLSLTELSAVSEELGLQPSEEIKSSCRLLRRLILGNLESEDVTGLEDTGLSVLLATDDFIDSLKKKKKTYEASRDNVSAREGETNEQPDCCGAPPVNGRWHYTSTSFVTTGAKQLNRLKKRLHTN